MGGEGVRRSRRSGEEGRQVMRREGPGRECLLADYLELGKIKRHTHIQSYLLSSFLSLSLSHTYRGDWSTAGCYPWNSIWGREEMSRGREGRGGREGDRTEEDGEGGVASFYP